MVDSVSRNQMEWVEGSKIRHLGESSERNLLNERRVEIDILSHVSDLPEDVIQNIQFRLEEYYFRARAMTIVNSNNDVRLYQRPTFGCHFQRFLNWYCDVEEEWLKICH